MTALEEAAVVARQLAAVKVASKLAEVVVFLALLGCACWAPVAIVPDVLLALGAGIAGTAALA